MDIAQTQPGTRQAGSDKESLRVLENLRAVAARAHNLANCLREHTNTILLGEPAPPQPTPSAAIGNVPSESFEPGYCGAIDRVRADIRDALNSINEDLDRLNVVF